MTEAVARGGRSVPPAIGCHNGGTEDNAWRPFAAGKGVRICEEDHLRQSAQIPER